MVKRQYLRRIGIALAASLYLVGCGQSNTQTTTAAPTTVAETTLAPTTEAPTTEAPTTEAATTAAETVAAESDVDRYDEMMTMDGTEGKLTFFFIRMDSDPDTGDKAGDGTVIISPDGKVMVLDAGIQSAAHFTVEALQKLGVEKIDYLVSSHPHIDHVGGLPEVVENFPVDKSYSSYVTYTTNTWNNYVEATKTANEHIYLKTGDVIEFGDYVTIEILGPDEEVVYPDEFPNKSTEFLNNSSLVMKFHYGESTALFSGDLYSNGEADYVKKYGDELHVDLAKINHHGYNTSSSIKWCKAVAPQVAVAVGSEPASQDPYNSYVKRGAEVHYTYFDGCVRVSMDDAHNLEVVDQYDSWMN